VRFQPLSHLSRKIEGRRIKTGGLIPNEGSPLAAEVPDYINPASKRRRNTLFRHPPYLSLMKGMAEGAGFEPAIPCGITVFETAAFNHSAILPVSAGGYPDYLLNGLD
jgi:hypothetical protein